MSWGPNGEWIWDTPTTQQASPAPVASGRHPYVAAAIRGLAPIVSAEGGYIGAGLSGLAEGAAQWAEGNPLNYRRIAAEAALGAVPFGKIVKGGQVLRSAAKSGALAGVGDLLRQKAEGEDLSFKHALLPTVIGAATGGIGAKLFPGAQLVKPAEEAVPAGRVITHTYTDMAPKPPVMPAPRIQTGPFQTTSNTWPVPLPAPKANIPNLTQEAASQVGELGNSGAGAVVPSTLAAGGKLVGEAGKVHKTIIQAEGAAAKLGLPKTAVKKVEGGFIVNGKPVGEVIPTNVSNRFAKTPISQIEKEIAADDVAKMAAQRGTPADIPNNPTAQRLEQERKVIEKSFLGKAGNTAVKRGTDIASIALPVAGAAIPDDPNSNLDDYARVGLGLAGLGAMAVSAKGRFGKSPKTVDEMMEKQGITAGLHKGGSKEPVATPISGAMQAYPEGQREGYLFGQHQLGTIEKAAKAGDTIVKPSLLSRLKGERGAVNLEDAAQAIQKNPVIPMRLVGGALGATTGAILGGPEHRWEGALLGGATGAALPSIPSMLKGLGVKPEVMQELDLSSPNGIKEAASKIAYTLPQVQRFNYLASIPGLGANGIVGPYGAAFTGSLERGLSGDARGWKALSVLKNPANFIKIMKDPATRAEAERLMAAGATPERALMDVSHPENMAQEIHDMSKKGIQFITKRLQGPGEFMVQGDEAARHILRNAGFTEAESRLMTMTSEPRTATFRGLAHFGAGNPLTQLLFPFRRTPANMAERGIERLPGVGFVPHMFQSGNKNIVDPLKLQLVQQALGVPAAGIGYAVGANTSPENMRLMRKYLTNAAGAYSLPVSIGLAAGLASQTGKDPFEQGLTTGVREAIPLPSTQPITDVIKFGKTGQVPRGWKPAVWDEIVNNLGAK